MSSVKKRRLCIIALVLAVCVSLGTVLMIRASAPVEPKTVYLLPKPNPERAEILARALQPKRHAYATRASGEAHVQDTREERSGSSSSELSSRDAEFDDAELESYLLGLEDEVAEEKRDFPSVPDGYLADNPLPVWLKYPGYQKGDMPEHELIGRVLIKLWNQGHRGFQGGVLRDNNGKVYPLYLDVLYVKWAEKVINFEDGSSMPIRYIATSIGTHVREFEPIDFITGNWETKYPGTRFVAYGDAGYHPYSFLTEND